MTKRPLVEITIAFSLGIFLASKIKLLFLWVYVPAILFVILGLMFINRERILHILLLFLSFLLGALVLINSSCLPKNHISNLASSRGMHIYLEGVIDSDPIEQANKVSFVLKAKNLKMGDYWYKVSGKVLVKKGGRYNLFYGDRLITEGKLYRPFYFPLSGRFHYRNYLKAKGIHVILSVKNKDTFHKIQSRKGNAIIYFIFKLRHRLKNIVDKNLSNLSGSILNAVILGLRQDLPKQILDALVNTGTVHIIAISGLHLGIVAFIVLIFLKLIRIPKRPRYIIAIFILLIYCILTGSSVPVVRSTIMATILLLGYTIKREVDIYNSLSLAALIILFINPQAFFEVSFQLSFLSILSLVWLSPKINSLFPDKLKESKYFKFLISIFSCSLAVWLGLCPLIIYHFRIISPITIVANMVIVPYMTLVIACGFTFLLTGLIFPPLISLFSPAAEISLLFLLKFVSLLNRVPFGHFQLP